MKIKVWPWTRLTISLSLSSMVATVANVNKVGKASENTTAQTILLLTPPVLPQGLKYMPGKVTLNRPQRYSV